MVRRAAMALRMLLFLLGALFSVLVPVSLFAYITVFCPWPTAQASEDNWQVVVVHIGDDARCGTLRISVLESAVTHQRRFKWTIAAERVEFTRVPMRLKPAVYRSSPFTVVYIPLWLLAVLCLAWPVTSFVVARRRRPGRGFEVEAKEAAVPASGS